MSEQSVTCLNGTFLPSDEALISVADRGFRFGDGVFETIRLEKYIPYQWKLHLRRMEAGLDALRITPPAVDWQATARELITRNAASEGFLRITISRGIGSRGYMPTRGITPTWVMEIAPVAPLPRKPLKLWQSTINRPPLSAVPANYKLAHGIGSTLALLEAQEHGCDDVVMMTHTGRISETATANLFWFAGGTLFTPSLATNCLAGTTRDALLRLSPVPVEEISADMNALAAAEAVFISNARLGVWPVSDIQPLGRQYDVDHTIITQLTMRLAVDREEYVTHHRAQWMRA